MPRIRVAALVVCIMLAAPAANAVVEPGYRVYVANAKFETVRDDLHDAIVNRGFVIDHVGHFSAMLDRTAEAIGISASPYANAEYVQFCPLKLTHEAAKATPFAIANCPITIFVFETRETPGKINVGYRFPPATPSSGLARVNEKLVHLLDEISREAAAK